MAEPLIKIRDFSKGITDNYARGKNPEGSLADCRNLVPSKAGGLETIHGYSKGNVSSHVSGQALPTVFNVPAIGSTTVDMASVASEPFAYSSEIPLAYDGRVHFLLDDAAGKHVLLDTWFKNSETKVTSPNNGFVDLGEHKIIDADHADVSRPTATTIQVNNAASHGLSATDDYYNDPPWKLEFFDFSAAAAKYFYATIKDYAVVADTATITLYEDISVTGLIWPVFSTSDTLTLRRWFHGRGHWRTENHALVPSFGTRPGQCFDSENRVRGCGGPVNDASYVPWVSQYLDKTFFQNSGTPVPYKGTYVDAMEPHSPASDGFSERIEVSDGVQSGDPLPDGTYNIYLSFELDGYLESSIYYVFTQIPSTQEIKFTINLHLSRISKRVTAINVYLNTVVSGVASSAFFIDRIDVLNDTPSWTYTTSTATYDLVDHLITGTKWENKGATYASRNWGIEDIAVSDDIDDKNTVYWQYAAIVSGRAFFGDYFDPVESETVKDSFRFTEPNQYDIIPYDRLYFEKFVASGDPSSIKALIEDEKQLIVFKDNGIYSHFIGPDPNYWVPTTVSLQDGLLSERGICKVPGRGIVFADVEALKLLSNQKVIPVTTNMEQIYFGLSGKATIVCWYDKIDRSINFTNGEFSSESFYKGFLDKGYTREDGRYTIPWYPCVITEGNGVEFVMIERDGGVFFTNSTDPFPGLFEWSKNVSLFGTGAIQPYLETHDLLADQNLLIALDKVVLTKSVSGNTGNLDTRISIDGTNIDFSNQTKTLTELYQKLSPANVSKGRKIRYYYNLDGFPESNSVGKVQIDEIQFFGRTEKALNQSA